MQKTEALAFLTYQNQRASNHTSIGPASLKQAVGFRDRTATDEPKWVDLRDLIKVGGFRTWSKEKDDGQFEEKVKRDMKIIEDEERHLHEEGQKLLQRQRELQKMKFERRELDNREFKDLGKKRGEREEAVRRSGMVGPARAELAFSSRHDIRQQHETPGTETLSSRPTEESYLSYSYRTGREKLSLHESAPGSRWPQRLSAQRNCGFAGGVKRGLRRDAVNELLIGSPRRSRRRRMVPVPQGLQDAMRRGGRIDKDLDIPSGSEGEDEEYYSAEEEDVVSEEEDAISDEESSPGLDTVPLHNDETYAREGIALRRRSDEIPQSLLRGLFEGQERKLEFTEAEHTRWRQTRDLNHSSPTTARSQTQAGMWF